MKKIEAELTTKLLKALRNDRDLLPESVWVEVKQVVRGKPFYLSALSDKAKRLLKKNNFTYKFSDMAGATPLDFIHIHNIKTYLCIIWHAPRRSKISYFILEKNIKDRIKITEDQARELSEYIITL